jgi:hypothetical protein
VNGDLGLNFLFFTNYVLFRCHALVRLDNDGDNDDQDSSETNNYKIFDPADMPDGTIDIPLWAQVEKTIICRHDKIWMI